MAGTTVDVVVAALAYLARHIVHTPLLRLARWITFTVKAMVAAGYWLFSGVLGLGDWSPVGDGGLAPLRHPWLQRFALTSLGLVAYIGAIRLANRSIDAMLGGGAAARATRMRMAMTVYRIGGAGALLDGLFNPHGLVITLISVVASTFCGTAVLFNVAYRSTPAIPPPPPGDRPTPRAAHRRRRGDGCVCRSARPHRLPALTDASASADGFAHDQHRQLQRLLVVQPWIDRRLVGPREIRLGQVACAAHALGDVLAG